MWGIAKSGPRRLIVAQSIRRFKSDCSTMTETKLKKIIHEVASNLPNWKSDGLRFRWTEVPSVSIKFDPKSIEDSLDRVPVSSAKTYVREMVKTFERALKGQ